MAERELRICQMAISNMESMMEPSFSGNRYCNMVMASILTVMSVRAILSDSGMDKFFLDMSKAVESGSMTIAEVLATLAEAKAKVGAVAGAQRLEVLDELDGGCGLGEKGQEKRAGKEPRVLGREPIPQSGSGEFVALKIPLFMTGVGKGSGECSSSTSLLAMVNMLTNTEPIIESFLERPLFSPGFTQGDGEYISITSKLAEIKAVMDKVMVENNECQPLEYAKILIDEAYRRRSGGFGSELLELAKKNIGKQQAVAQGTGESASTLVELVKMLSGLTGAAFLSFARSMPSSSSSKWPLYATAGADAVSFCCGLLCFLLYEKMPERSRFLGAIGCIAFVLTLSLSVGMMF